MKKLFVILALVLFCAVAVTLPSCKAWRTITTTSTYTAANDSAKSTITIQSKTSEEYTGIRKR